MKSKSKWTPEEESKLLTLRREGKTRKQAARILGRSVRAVERKLELMVDKTPPVDTVPVEMEVPPTDNPADTIDFWRHQTAILSKQLEQERWNKTVVQALVEEAKQLAPHSYDPAPSVSWPERRGGSPQSAVLLLSDTHIGQVVEPEQTLGYGGYNLDVFMSRLKRLEQAVHSILADHVTTPVKELVVPILGDMIHGNLAHSVEAGQHHTLFEQFYVAGHALAQFLRNISTLAPITRIYTAVGNHPRWGTQKKMPTDNRYSNFDQFLYAYMQALTRDCVNIEWTLDKQPFAVFDVQGFTFYCGHGDHLRGGDKALGIPAHSIGRHLGTSMGLRSRQGKSLVNYYCFGHLHKPIQLPHTLGEVIVNGGFPGVDGFGLMEGFQAYPPSQRFFLVHPKFGRAACYDLRLDFEPEGKKPHYTIPKI
jgi:hypothetical protein